MPETNNRHENPFIPLDIKKPQKEEDIIRAFQYQMFSLWDILHYQKNLSAEFCVKYLVFNDEFSSCDEDTYIDFYDVLRKQPHLLLNDLVIASNKK